VAKQPAVERNLEEVPAALPGRAVIPVDRLRESLRRLDHLNTGEKQAVAHARESLRMVGLKVERDAPHDRPRRGARRALDRVDERSVARATVRPARQRGGGCDEGRG
jgi:hypothetical protein